MDSVEKVISTCQHPPVDSWNQKDEAEQTPAKVLGLTFGVAKETNGVHVLGWAYLA